MREITVDVTVSIDDIMEAMDDEEFLEEAKNRGLSLGDMPIMGKPADLIKDALSDLMTRRTARAIDTMKEAIAQLVPAGLLAAYEAALQGNTASAICELERAIKPSEAATAKTLPVRNVHESVDVMRGAV